MKWMVSGGAGYIGSHVVHSLQARGHQVAVLDDLSTGDRQRLSADTALYEGSVLDTDFVIRSLKDHHTDGVVHLAAKKAVEESVSDPLTYYDQNVVGMLSLLQAMVLAGVRAILFSSSAAVYGVPDSGLVTEEAPTSPASPYGTTKLISEQMLRDVAAAEHLNWAALRYFNVAGAVSPALADRGENNLIPRVFRAVTSGVQPQIYGTDYPTRDGTCIRDYIHVGDVAEAHAAVAERMADGALSATYNIGTGTGTSVLEVMLATRRITGIDFSWDERPPRAGDPPEVIADATKIRTELGWQSKQDLDSIIGSAWQAWQG
jgi:UDP-glucose 4-epimerase